MFASNKARDIQLMKKIQQIDAEVSKQSAIQGLSVSVSGVWG
jgi:hypothetical protein